MSSTKHRPLTLVKSDGLPDWYTIEWAEHEHKGWLETVSLGPTPTRPEGYTYHAYRWSGRPSDADIEGTAAEMLAIAAAIELRLSTAFRRCAAQNIGLNEFGPDRAQTDGYELFSPRNSQIPAIISFAQADHLAAEIRRVLNKPKE